MQDTTLSPMQRLLVPFPLWLLGSHVTAALVALALARSGAVGSILVVAAVGVAALLGLLLAWPLQRTLTLAEQSLAHLSRGEGIQALPAGSRWPLASLLAQVEAMAARERVLEPMRAAWQKEIGEAAVQEERNRLARDLHDSIKQQLFSINISAAAVQARWEHDAAGARAALADVRRSTHEAMVEMQAMLQQLCPAPLATVGLVEALREQVEALGYRTGAEVTSALGPLPDDGRLLPGTQEALFRIAQEALANVARHARARQVAVRLGTEGDDLLLEVRDDGQGFDPTQAASGMGMSNMQERALALGGSLEVASQRGTGTTIRIRVPLAEPAAPTAKEFEMSQSLKHQFQMTHVALLGRAVAGGLGLTLLLWLLRLVRHGGAGGGEVALLLLATTASFAGVWYSQSWLRRLSNEVALTTGQGSATALKFDAARGWWQTFIYLFYILLLPLPLVRLGDAPAYPIVALLLGLLVLLVALRELGSFYQSTERYMALLTPAERQAEESSIAVHEYFSTTVAILLPSLLPMVSEGYPLAFPPQPDDVYPIVFLLWSVTMILGDGVRFVQLARWRRRAAPPVGV